MLHERKDTGTHGAGDISEASDDEIDAIPDEAWEKDLVDSCPFYDLGIPLEELLQECNITEEELSELEDDYCLVLEDGKEIQFEEDINNGYSFITIRLYFNQEGMIRKVQYIGHQHDDIGYDEVLLELPTVFHNRCFMKILKELEDKGLIV